MKDPFLSQWASNHLHKLTSDSPWRVLGRVQARTFSRDTPLETGVQWVWGRAVAVVCS